MFHRLLENPLFSNCVLLPGIIFTKMLLPQSFPLVALTCNLQEVGASSLTVYPPAVNARSLPASQVSSNGRPDGVVFPHLQEPLLPSQPKKIDLAPFTGAVKWMGGL